MYRPTTIGKSVGLFLSVALLAVPFMSFAAPDDKVTICHATGSATNPYVTIHVSENAIRGHFENNGTASAGHEDDLLLQGEVDCPTVPPHGGGGGGGSGTTPDGKVTICHATGSATNPFVTIHTASSSINGHFDNNGTPLSGHEDDILFPTETDCPDDGQGGGGGTPVYGTLVVIKSVINDDGGSAQPGVFTIAVTSATSAQQVAGSPQLGNASGTPYTLSPGNYTVSELYASTSYATSFSGACNSQGVVTVSQNATSTCTIINNDVPRDGGGGGSGGATGVLVVKKIVVNDNGGSATSSSFHISVTNASSTHISDSPFVGSLNGTAHIVPPGTYTVSEQATSSYAGSFSGACNGAGVVTVTEGATSTCVITNNDVATSTCDCGGGGQFGLLTIIKHAEGGNGTFGFVLSGSTVATTSVTTFSGFGMRIVALDGLGTTTLSEIVQMGWAHTSTSCVQNGFATGTSTASGFTFNFSVQGGAVVCNVYNAATTTATTTPGGGGGSTSTSTKGAIVVIKNVVGGTASSSAYMINVMTGTTSIASTSVHIAGSPQVGTTTGTAYMNVATGTYMISESGGPGGYTISFSGACDGNGLLSVTAGATSTCTITNTFPTPAGGGGGGGGSTAVSSGGGGGGGGNGPISTILPNNAPAPILGGGGFSPGQVLGNSVSLPNDGMGGYVPGVPNTGSGGLAAGYVIIMLLCFAALLGGIVSLRRN